jgi:uncharacterized SAM-binding protein YcdF (DUF218 family)
MRLGFPTRRSNSVGFSGVALLVGVTAAATVVQFGGPVSIAMAKWLGPALATRIPPAALHPGRRVDGIIAMGGSSRRVAAALDLAQRFPGARLVLSGPDAGEITLATAALGRSERLTIDRRPRNTYENALYSRDLLQPGPGETWIMVTSALHMPRSVGVFQAVGFAVLPWPIQDTPASPEALSASVWHEVLGLAGYHLLGRTTSLFPRVDPGTVPVPSDGPTPASVDAAST